MLIAFSVDRDSEKAMMDSRFGRCPFFALLDDQSGDIEYVANPAAGATTGAGTGAAQALMDRVVEAVVTGQVGPNAMQILLAADIPVFLVEGQTTLDAACQQWRQGKLHRYQVQRF